MVSIASWISEVFWTLVNFISLGALAIVLGFFCVALFLCCEDTIKALVAMRKFNEEERRYEKIKKQEETKSAG